MRMKMSEAISIMLEAAEPMLQDGNEEEQMAYKMIQILLKATKTDDLTLREEELND